jgi:hypothetical protein
MIRNQVCHRFLKGRKKEKRRKRKKVKRKDKASQNLDQETKIDKITRIKRGIIEL